MFSGSRFALNRRFHSRSFSFPWPLGRLSRTTTNATTCRRSSSRRPPCVDRRSKSRNPRRSCPATISCAIAAPASARRWPRTAGVSATYFGPQASRPVIRGPDRRTRAGQRGRRRVARRRRAVRRSRRHHRSAARRARRSAARPGHAALRQWRRRRTRQRARAPRARAGLRRHVEGAAEVRGAAALDERAAAVRVDGGVDGWSFHGDAYARDTDDVEIAGLLAVTRARAQSGRIHRRGDRRRPRPPRRQRQSLCGGALGVSRVGDAGFAGVAVSRFETQYGIPGRGGRRVDRHAADAFRLQRRLASARTVDRLRAPARISFNRYEHAELEPGGEVGTQFDQDGLVGATHDRTRAARPAGAAPSACSSATSISRRWAKRRSCPASVTRNLGVFGYEERAFGPVTLEARRAARTAGDHARRRSARITTSRVRVSPADSSGGSRRTGARRSTSRPRSGIPPRRSCTPTARTSPSSASRSATPACAPSAPGPWTFRCGIAAERWSMSAHRVSQRLSRLHLRRLTGDIEDELPVASVPAGRRATSRASKPKSIFPRWRSPAASSTTRLVADAVRAELGRRRRPAADSAAARWARKCATRATSGRRACPRIASAGSGGSPTTSCPPTATRCWERTRRGACRRRSARSLAYLRGENLLDEDARRHTSPLKEFAPLPGRSIGAGVRLDF